MDLNLLDLIPQTKGEWELILHGVKYLVGLANRNNRKEEIKMEVLEALPEE